MLQPEEVLIEFLGNSGIEAWSRLDSVEDSERFVLINRVSTEIENRTVGLEWTDFTYSIDLQCYTKGDQLDAYIFSEQVLEILKSIYYQDFRVGLGINSIGWLPPLNDLSGASLGITMIITQGD